MEAVVFIGGICLLVFSFFTMGRAYEQHRLTKEWLRISSEWDEIKRHRLQFSEYSRNVESARTAPKGN